MTITRGALRYVTYDFTRCVTGLKHFSFLFIYFTTHVTKKQDKSTKNIYILQRKWWGSFRRKHRAYIISR